VFTGLIQAVGRIDALAPTEAGVRLVIDAGAWKHQAAPGESIAVSGCCLTLAEPAGPTNRLAFDVIPETLERTTLGSLEPGARVNLEPSLTPSSLLGGHFVQGHVDGLGRIDAIQTEGQWRVRVVPPPELMQFVAPKGSIAIEGVSLTIAAVDPTGGWLEVALIPTTLRETTLGELRAGGRVNLEMDILAKTAVHWLRHYAERSGWPPADA